MQFLHLIMIEVDKTVAPNPSSVLLQRTAPPLEASPQRPRPPPLQRKQVHRATRKAALSGGFIPGVFTSWLTWLHRNAVDGSKTLYAQTPRSLLRERPLCHFFASRPRSHFVRTRLSTIALSSRDKSERPTTSAYSSFSFRSTRHSSND